jgi:hypothetical protein
MVNPTQGLLPFKSHLEVYKVSGGNLKLVQMTPQALAIGVSGIGVS